MLDTTNRAAVAFANGSFVCLSPAMGNRHGLISGATGTGKTVTLQTLAETFSQMGVPVFAADIKGDLSGVAVAGGNRESVNQRVRDCRLEDHGFAFRGFPVQFWDVFGLQGIPVRATVADMGDMLLARLLQLNDTQSAVLAMIFKIAKDMSLELTDLKDLQKTLEYTRANAPRLSPAYGNLPANSIGAIQRNVMALQQEGADDFFGEPALNIEDLMHTVDGRGVINILAADQLMQSPRAYTTFLLWLLTKLFTSLPEAGDRDKPALVFFFDEAHLLFANAPRVLVERIEQVVRLIRSKGVGIFFLSQSPTDSPDSVLGQLGNRVQHALRAYTPNDIKGLKAAARSFRANPAFDAESAIAELGIGEALISFLDAKGVPAPVERAWILPPQGQIGPLDAAQRESMLQTSLLYRVYAEKKDRFSAFEALNAQQAEDQRQKEEAQQLAQAQKAAQDEEKRKEKEKAQQIRFWSGVAKSVLVPIVRRFLAGMFRR